MNKLSLILFLIVSTNTFALDCTGLKREVINGNAVVKTEKLEKFFEIPGYVKYQANIEEGHFAVDLSGSQVTSYITIGPDYTTGNLSKGELGEEGYIKLSYVTPDVTYILECFDK
ncbi:MAG: hypothetical protein EP319_11585 [Deltaproteobacteria bacterium]|nr:MAG: hypothetical protein EP319_11585 [Deltaproteobacteria bacterium]